MEARDSRTEAAWAAAAGRQGAAGLPGAAGRRSYHRRVADQENQPLAQLLEELGAQLAWVREYL